MAVPWAFPSAQQPWGVPCGLHFGTFANRATLGLNLAHAAMIVQRILTLHSETRAPLARFSSGAGYHFGRCHAGELAL